MNGYWKDGKYVLESTLEERTAKLESENRELMEKLKAAISAGMQYANSCTELKKDKERLDTDNRDLRKVIADLNKQIVYRLDYRPV